MRRVVDVLLVLVLFSAIAYLFFVLGDQVGGVWFETPTPTKRSPSTQAPTLTATITLTLSRTPTSTSILTATRTAIPTSTRTPTQTATLTSLPSSTSTTLSLQAEVEQEINDGIQRGDQIVQAIESYYQAENQYPSTLGILAPNFISNIPVTVTGQSFFYRLFDGTGPLAAELYWVSFKVASQEHVACTYFRRLDYWDCNFASP